MIERFINNRVRGIKPYVAGATKEEVARKHGFSPDDVVKLASNENPFGPSPQAAAAIKNHASDVYLYPEDYPTDLIHAISKYLQVPEKMIIPGGNGADEIMDVVIKLVVSEGDEVIVHHPTFPYYGLLTRLYGGRTVEVPMTEGYRFPAQQMIEKVSDRTKLLVICSPNNPTGTVIAADDLKELLNTDVLVMLDEAYVEFADTSLTGLVNDYENLIVLRTFSKAFGLAGLRVGYGVASEELVKQAMKIKPPHNVNLLAQKAAAVALSDIGHMRRSVEDIKRQRERVYSELKAIEGIRAYQSQANFHLITFEDAGIEACSVVEELERRGIIVRWCGGFGLEDSIRVSVGTEGENRRFLTAFKEVLG